MAKYAPTRIVGAATDLAELLPVRSHARQSAHYYSTPEGFAAHVASIDRPLAWSDSAWSESRGTNPARGTNTMAEALAMARDGWQEGAERAARIRDKIIAANPTGPRLVKWDVAGAVPSVPRYLAGNPLNMRRVDSARLRRRPVLTLVSDMCVSWNVDAAQLINRAAVVAAVIDRVESAGFACHVVAACDTATRDIVARAAVTLKESSAPADIARLAFGLGHAAMFRRMCFAAFKENEYTKALGAALGDPIEIEQTNAMRDAGVYVLPSAQHGGFATEDQAATHGLAKLIAALVRQGCPAFPDERAAA